jgi:hypothetical protein
MPNRYIRDGWKTSDRIDGLSPEAECFFLRLILSADDFALMDGRPRVLESTLYPLRRMPDGEVEKLLVELVKAGLVRLETGKNGSRLVEVLRFSQRRRASSSKYRELHDNDGHGAVKRQSSVGPPPPTPTPTPTPRTEEKRALSAPNREAEIGPEPGRETGDADAPDSVPGSDLDDFASIPVLVEAVKSSRPEYATLNRMSLENALRSDADRPVIVQAVREWLISDAGSSKPETHVHDRLRAFVQKASRDAASGGVVGMAGRGAGSMRLGQAEPELT